MFGPIRHTEKEPLTTEHPWHPCNLKYFLYFTRRRYNQWRFFHITISLHEFETIFKKKKGMRSEQIYQLTQNIWSNTKKPQIKCHKKFVANERIIMQSSDWPWEEKGNDEHEFGTVGLLFPWIECHWMLLRQTKGWVLLKSTQNKISITYIIIIPIINRSGLDWLTVN